MTFLDRFLGDKNPLLERLGESGGCGSTIVPPAGTCAACGAVGSGEALGAGSPLTSPGEIGTGPVIETGVFAPDADCGVIVLNCTCLCIAGDVGVWTEVLLSNIPRSMGDAVALLADPTPLGVGECTPLCATMGTGLPPSATTGLERALLVGDIVPLWW
eukprot:GFYU01033812.1.p2 GENE.GFYU01033812.1~~GFYU01033812.1.p2  ORF type:complete len:159 (+),score=16.13 GFYU01033812.1:123-599(+)